MNCIIWTKSQFDASNEVEWVKASPVKDYFPGEIKLTRPGFNQRNTRRIFDEY